MYSAEFRKNAALLLLNWPSVPDLSKKSSVKSTWHNLRNSIYILKGYQSFKLRYVFHVTVSCQVN